MSLKDIEWPSARTYRTGSDNSPLKFFSYALKESIELNLLLGYFSTGSIRVLAPSFAYFIANGGTLNLVINHILSEEDKNLLKEPAPGEDSIFDLTDIKYLLKQLKGFDRHFFNCLSYLIHTKRINFCIIQPIKGNGIAHHKQGYFLDKENNRVSFNGSANFTSYGLLQNIEAVEVCLEWDNELSKTKVLDVVSQNESYQNRTAKVKYLDVEDIQSEISDHFGKIDLEELIARSGDIKDDLVSESFEREYKEINTFFKQQLELKTKPRFPFDGGPRDYQKEAFEEWVKSDYSGVFAMATGTGKTITSLNCLLNIYNDTNYYRAIILVPSIALLNQWEEEVQSFNFQNILKVGGGNKWEQDFANYCSNYSWGLKNDLVIISTYGSFVLDRFQKSFKKIQKEFLLIADEAHNMGANNIKSKIQKLEVKKKIGLSATPKRVYDPEGTDAIDKFFNDSPPYTYSFGMERALDEGFLTGYKYFPLVVELTDEEFEEYTLISKQLLKFFDFENGKFKDDPIVEILLLKRKNIIHKAQNKISLFSSIIRELKKTEKDKYVFAYIPEGYTAGADGDSVKILNKYLRRVHKDLPDVKMNSYTSSDQDLNEILRGFEEGKIEILFAMKMLDEGVDVPRAEVGIFASSTGNPRQFVQRRGRLLRKHKDKAYATIYDMVVVPKIDNNNNELFNIERNLVKNELTRVAYFASLSLNFYDSKEALLDISRKYNLDLDTIINDL